MNKNKQVKKAIMDAELVHKPSPLVEELLVVDSFEEKAKSVFSLC